MPDSQDFPRATLAPEPRRSVAWIVPLIALLAAALLVWQTVSGSGTEIEVHAERGHGIGAGDALRYRGITVGEITDVRLEPDLSRVSLRVRLHPTASGIAREGSRFWVVRPHLSLEGVQGLETIVGARYLSVLPGPREAARRRDFVALDEPPVAEHVEPAGLQFVIESPARFGLAPGAAIHYRGVRVGTLLDVRLASDATSVELRAYVRAPYVQLVREDTRFWEMGGLEVDLGWVRGLKIEVDSLRALLVGGLTMATPPSPGAPVTDGHRFALALDPKPEWLEWRTALPVGAREASAQASLPELVPAELSWKSSGLLRRSKTRSGWLLPVPGGLLGPADLLSPEADARDDAMLEILGERLPLTAEPELTQAGLAFLAFDHPELSPWPEARVAASSAARDCLLVIDSTQSPLAVAASRLIPIPIEGGWRIENGPDLDPTWHGAAAVSRDTGELMGLLLLNERAARIVRPLDVW